MLCLDFRERANAVHVSEPNVLILQSEVAQIKNRCASLDKENVELRRLLGGDRTPKYLPLSPHAAQQSPSPMSSTPGNIYVKTRIIRTYPTYRE